MRTVNSITDDVTRRFMAGEAMSPAIIAKEYATSNSSLHNVMAQLRKRDKFKFEEHMEGTLKFWRQIVPVPQTDMSGWGPNLELVKARGGEYAFEELFDDESEDCPVEDFIEEGKDVFTKEILERDSREIPLPVLGSELKVVSLYLNEEGEPFRYSMVLASSNRDRVWEVQVDDFSERS